MRMLHLSCAPLRKSQLDRTAKTHPAVANDFESSCSDESALKKNENVESTTHYAVTDKRRLGSHTASRRAQIVLFDGNARNVTGVLGKTSKYCIFPACSSLSIDTH
ncbi:hypothetical protein KIN20_015681 [Parelaphostrongylus tenuis]|uniref:Uncharacterized protein n=1 Tax=Parelaphostrongylus tenuis TaxID=148309 RepID=A0AAD5MFA7_PARTN|nr:hypothetical protein KIN20_015681 [Parelaphostrongylus tenuis]